MPPEFKATCDLADIFTHETHSIDTQFRSFGGKTQAAGAVHTILCFQDNLLVKQTLNTPNSGDILVIDGAGSIHTALVGDLIAGAAVTNNWGGIIVNAAIRDSAQLAELPIHIKALGTNPRKSQQTGSGSYNVPITLDGITITPGDWLFSDADGIIIVTSEQKNKILAG